MKIYSLLGLLIYIQVFAQQKQVDSLKQELSKHQQTDTIRIDLLNELAYIYQNIDPELGISAADQAIILARKINAPKRLAIAHAYKALNYKALDKDSLALLMYKKRAKFIKKLVIRLESVRPSTT
jgi:hypothetical protein